MRTIVLIITLTAILMSQVIVTAKIEEICTRPLNLYSALIPTQYTTINLTKKACNIAPNKRCGPTLGSCPIPGEFCSDANWCGVTDKYKSLKNSEYKFRRECDIGRCSSLLNRKCGVHYGNLICGKPGDWCYLEGDCGPHDDNHISFFAIAFNYRLECRIQED